MKSLPLTHQARVARGHSDELASLRAAHETDRLTDRQQYGQALDKLQHDVDALTAVLSHDTQYKRASHAVCRENSPR